MDFFFNFALLKKLILYDGYSGLPKLSFGNGRRNTIRFDPFGRFLCFAGFGNLPGSLILRSQAFVNSVLFLMIYR
jgi:hypothetical protein